MATFPPIRGMSGRNEASMTACWIRAWNERTTPRMQRPPRSVTTSHGSRGPTFLSRGPCRGSRSVVPAIRYMSSLGLLLHGLHGVVGGDDADQPIGLVENLTRSLGRQCLEQPHLSLGRQLSQQVCQVGGMDTGNRGRGRLVPSPETWTDSQANAQCRSREATGSGGSDLGSRVPPPGSSCGEASAWPGAERPRGAEGSTPGWHRACYQARESDVAATAPWPLGPDMRSGGGPVDQLTGDRWCLCCSGL